MDDRLFRLGDHGRYSASKFAMNNDRASQLVSHVYNEHITHFGEPDHSIVFDDRNSVKPAPKEMPERIEVLVLSLIHI